MTSAKKRVLIAGGGVAALEAMLALQQLAPELVDVELIAPEPRFFYRPLAVAEPFGLGDVRSFDLAELADRAGAAFEPGSLVGVDTKLKLALTEPGGAFAYDLLLIACGAHPVAAVPGALAFRGPADTAMVSQLLERIDAGEVRHVVVVVPLGATWSLPAYELALLLATRADAQQNDVRIALVTPEDDPLLLFGENASRSIRQLLEENGIALHAGYHATIVRDGALHLLPSVRLEADAVIALPSLRGLRLAGIPQTRDGFVPVDDYGRVDGIPDVYAAGDITRFPVKQGGIAAQQADAAAHAIAAAAGAAVEARPFRPILRGLLLTGREPRYLRRDVAGGGQGSATVEPLWWPPAKLVGRHLAPFLAEIAGFPAAEPAPTGHGVLAIEREVEPEDVSRVEPPMVHEDDAASTVGEVMTTELLLVAPEDTLGEVAERMSAQDVGSALVADNGRLIGILTSRDLIHAFASRIHSSEARVREWMTAEPIVAASGVSLAAAVRLMHAHSIHHLPVVEDDRPVGMVGMRAVVQALAEREARAHVGLGL